MLHTIGVILAGIGFAMGIAYVYYHVFNFCDAAYEAHKAVKEHERLKKTSGVLS